MLFGAGIVLMWERAQQAGRGMTGLHYRRMFWLILFGLAHAHLFWEGDILFTYGICGMLVYWLCGLRPRWLIPIGVILFSVCSGFYLLTGASIQYWPEDQVADMMEMWQPDPEQIEAELKAMQGTWLEQLPVRSASALYMEVFVFLFASLWRVSGLMLVGMALYKLRFLAAERSKRLYMATGVVCGLIGFTLVVTGVLMNENYDWALEYSFFTGSQFNYWGSVFVSLCYVSGLMLAVRERWFMAIQARLGAVGRMALSNYFLQTLICTTLFYGHGLGLYGQLSRVQLWGVVGVIWMIQLIVSPWWLERFYFGPFEWLWRSLSYWRLQPFSRRGAQGMAAREQTPLADENHRN